MDEKTPGESPSPSAGSGPVKDETHIGAVPSPPFTASPIPVETADIATSKNDEAQPGSSPGAAFLRLWTFFTPFDMLLRVLGFLASWGAGAALPLMTIIFGRLVNNFNSYGSGQAASSELLTLASHNALILVYLFIGKFVLVFIHTTCFTITANNAGAALRKAYIKALLRQDVSYFDTMTAGSVATSISTNVDVAQNGLAEKVGTASQGLAMLVAAYIVAFVKQWKLTLVTGTTMPAAVTAVGITVALDATIEAKILAIYSKAGGLVEEALSSIRIVTAFGAQGKMAKKYDAYLDEAKVFGRKRGPILGVMYSAEFFIMYCAYALSFWYGIRLLYTGEVTSSGTIITVLFSVLIGTSAVTMIAPAIGDFTKAAAAATKVFEVLDQEPNIDPLDNSGDTPEPGPGCFEMKGVSFAYPARPSVNILDNLDLKFDAGKVTAIVGASGSGKSTMVALLQRWYDPSQGSILLDGHDAKDLNVRWLRSQMGFVQQEPVLFNDTVYENVAHGLYGSDLDKLSESEKRKLVKNACIEANADAFIQNLPSGYDTNLGERGSLVSGGQRQRICIARSIVSNPGILLLDEATSALDPKAERIVQESLERVSRSRTTIVIAHKLSTVQKADRIVVLSAGKVIEQGTHASLLAANGGYASLVHAQNLHIGEKSEIAETLGEDTEDEVDLGKMQTNTSFHAMVSATEEADDVSRRLSLLHCLWIILREQRHLWPYLSLGFIGTLAGGAVFPIQSFVFSRIVTVFQLPRDELQNKGNFYALMFFIMALGVLFSYASIGLFFTIAGFLSTRVYRSEYFRAMIRQDPEYFELPDNSAGAMTSKLSTDPQKLQDLISVNMGLIFIVVVSLISNCILALAVGWKLALVAIFGCIPALFFAGFCRMRLEMGAQDRAAKPYRESARFVTEAVGAIRTVSSLTIETKVIQAYSNRLEAAIRQNYVRTIITMVFFGLSESLDLAATALCFWWGAKLLSEGEYSTQAFFIVFTAVIFGGQAAGFMFGYTSNTTKAHSAANHIIYLRDTQPPINSSTGKEPQFDVSDESLINFDNVRFAYPTRPNRPVLNGLSLSIKRGQSIGVVGASGCGKTTIIALLERFYDVSSGSIRIAGTELKDLDVHSYRSEIGLVGQETTVYQGSIRENVLLGLPDEIDNGSTDEKNHHDRVVEACKAANIHDFILSLPQGYETDTGSHGIALSGGQRQRLAIARALIRDPEILLFDEATSALDTQSERVVQAALIEASKGRTVVSVAHRLSTIRHCDCIFVIDAGRVAEQGTHDELIRRKKMYFEMVKGQSLDREIQT